jgi:hypothetical protein
MGHGTGWLWTVTVLWLWDQNKILTTTANQTVGTTNTTELNRCNKHVTEHSRYNKHHRTQTIGATNMSQNLVGTTNTTELKRSVQQTCHRTQSVQQTPQNSNNRCNKHQRTQTVGIYVSNMWRMFVKCTSHGNVAWSKRGTVPERYPK